MKNILLAMLMMAGLGTANLDQSSAQIIAQSGSPELKFTAGKQKIPAVRATYPLPLPK
jgi:hypothetical protein